MHYINCCKVVAASSLRDLVLTLLSTYATAVALQVCIVILHMWEGSHSLDISRGARDEPRERIHTI
jgi:hypothetical protein